MLSIVSFLLIGVLSETPVPAATVSTSVVQRDIAGIVMDVANAPIPEAEVTILKPKGIDKSTRTSRDGRFTLHDIPDGVVSIQFRRLGYEVRVIDIDTKSLTKPLDVMLKPLPEELEDITITNPEKSTLREFYAHKASNNFAKFFERKDIESRHATYVSEMLQTVPGAKLSSSANGYRVLFRDCKPMVWVDGSRSPGAELDELVRPNDVAGLEVYPSSAGLPIQYQDRNNRMCGAILVWTRNQ
jgi:hypothetical protein